MRPIEIKIFGHTQKSPQEICAAIIDTDRWPEFQGFSILPGIRNASFEIKTPNMVGSRIKVRNTDGSAHVEEIIEWDTSSKVALKFQEFDSPLKNLASHFVETWSFRKSENGTDVSRSMTMYPGNLIGWLILLPISRLMKKAFEKNQTQFGE